MPEGPAIKVVAPAPDLETVDVTAVLALDEIAIDHGVARMRTQRLPDRSI